MIEDAIADGLFKLKPPGCGVHHFLAQSKPVNGLNMSSRFTNCISPGEVECERSMLWTLMDAYPFKFVVNLGSNTFPTNLKRSKKNEINP